MSQSTFTAAIAPDRQSSLGVRSWARELASAAKITFRPPAYPAAPVPRGAQRTVLLIPGFLAGDWTMERLRTFLIGLDYRVECAGILFNPGPTKTILARIEVRLLALHAERGPVHVIGQSLGGIFAREMARRHPQCVRSVVTLCTPVRFPVQTPLAGFVKVLGPFHDAAWAAQAGAIAEPLPVPVTAIYSRNDGIVDWRQCLQDENEICRNICVAGAHSTMGSNPAAQVEIAMALAKQQALRDG